MCVLSEIRFDYWYINDWIGLFWIEAPPTYSLCRNQSNFHTIPLGAGDKIAMCEIKKNIGKNPIPTIDELHTEYGEDSM